MGELKKCSESYNVDIICVSESGFHKNIFEAEIDIPGYYNFRCDRDFTLDRSKNQIDISEGGGSIIYVKNNLHASLISSFKAPDSLAITLETPAGKIVVACVYRSTSLNETQDISVLSSLRQLCTDFCDYEIFIVGDFNMPDVSWVAGVTMGNLGSSSMSNEYLNMITDTGLIWYITDQITRRRVVDGKLQESTLDQIFCTNEVFVNDFKIVAPLGNSDHVCINIELDVDIEKNEEFIDGVKQRWDKLDSSEILKISQTINWEYSSTQLSVQQKWDELHGKLMEITGKVPTVDTKQTGHRKPWSSSALKRKRRLKDKQWSIFDEYPTAMNLNLALSYQQDYEKTEISAKVKYEKKITKNIKHNTKPFFSYLRSRRTVKTTVAPLIKPDGAKTNGPLETANLLADAFSSVFVSEPYGPLPEQCSKRRVNIDEDIIDIEICSLEVKQKLSQLNIYKSFGPDGVHPKLLKALSDNINFVDAVTDLFNTCAIAGTIPLVWKEANVAPLFKKSVKSDPLNYRPVSLTCILCKVYEKFIRQHIIDHVNDHLSDMQHGFVGGRSCFSNLLETVDTVLSMLSEGAPVDVLYLDFCKAFDTVPHRRLLAKLESYGITGKTLDIIRDFLSDRSMKVFVGGQSSNVHYVKSGVPQGSVLGPLLFVLFINDLPENLQTCVKLFADDLKLIGNTNNYDKIVSDISLLEEWEETWLLRFNPLKCKVLHIDKNDNPMKDYFIDGVKLTTVESECDLGVLTNSTLDWSDNVKDSIAKANRMIGWISRNVIDRSREVMLLVYKALIRPHVEYCVQIWTPTARQGNWPTILALEKVQRKFTRLIEGVGVLPYGERLNKLGLTTLAERRIRGDLIETFKILSGIVNYGRSLFKLSASGRNLVSMASINDKNRNDFFSNRVIKYWNKLPLYVKRSDDVNSFKINLDKFKKSAFYIEGNFWDVSREIIERIDTPSQNLNRKKHADFLRDHPWIAKKRGINIK